MSHDYAVGDLVLYNRSGKEGGRIFATRVAPYRDDWAGNKYLMSGVPLRDSELFINHTSCGRPENVSRSCLLEIALLALPEEFI